MLPVPPFLIKLRYVIPRKGTETEMTYYICRWNMVLVKVCNSPKGDGNNGHFECNSGQIGLRYVIPRKGTETYHNLFSRPEEKLLRYVIPRKGTETLHRPKLQQANPVKVCNPPKDQLVIVKYY